MKQAMSSLKVVLCWKPNCICTVLYCIYLETWIWTENMNVCYIDVTYIHTPFICIFDHILWALLWSWSDPDNFSQSQRLILILSSFSTFVKNSFTDGCFSFLAHSTYTTCSNPVHKIYDNPQQKKSNYGALLFLI